MSAEIERPACAPDGDSDHAELIKAVERMLKHGHDFWEKHQHSPDSDEMSAALTDLYFAHKRAVRVSASALSADAHGLTDHDEEET